jgi:hypothetical protein
MTEKDDFLEDDFLRDLVQKSSLESPSDDFVKKIMGQIQPQFQAAPVKKSFFLYLKSSSGYLVLAAFILFVLITSDIAFLNFIPGKLYFYENILPVFNSIILPLKALFSNGKSLTIPIMIVVAAGLFFILDLLMARKRAIQE